MKTEYDKLKHAFEKYQDIVSHINADQFDKHDMDKAKHIHSEVEKELGKLKNVIAQDLRDKIFHISELIGQGAGNSPQLYQDILNTLV